MNFDEDFEATERRKRHRYEPIVTYWALRAVALIDGQSPGCLRRMMKSKPVERHAAFAVLAAIHAPWRGEQHDKGGDILAADVLKAWGERLGKWSSSDLIKAAYGNCPDGLLGALRRLQEPIEPDDYRRLVVVFGDPSQRRRRQLLQYTRAISHDRLRAILELDPTLCVVRFARKVRRESHARIANDALAVVRSHRPDLSEEEIVEFLSQADEHARFADQIERMLRLVTELPPLPFEIPEAFRHLRTRDQFEDAGRRMHNCVAAHFSDALTGRVVFLEFARRPALAALITTNRGWFLGKVHAPLNAPAPPDLVEDVRAALAAAGVPYLVPAPLVGPLASIRMLLMRHDLFGLGPDEFQGVIHDLH